MTTLLSVRLPPLAMLKIRKCGAAPLRVMVAPLPLIVSVPLVDVLKIVGSPLLPDTYTSPLCAQRGAAKRER